MASGISWQNREEERNSQAVINTEGILWYLLSGHLPVVTSVLEQRPCLQKFQQNDVLVGFFLFPVQMFGNFMNFFLLLKFP